MAKQTTLKLTTAQEKALRGLVGDALSNMADFGGDEVRWNDSYGIYKTFKGLVDAKMLCGESNEIARFYAVFFVDIEGWFYALAHNWISELPDFAYDYSELQQYFEDAPAAAVSEAQPISTENTPQFQVGQAVHTRFWGDNVGRIVSATLMDWGSWYYEVLRPDGSMVFEPYMFVSAAPELEDTLPHCAPRPTLSSREVEARMDTPETEPFTPERDFWYENGVQYPIG